MPLHDPVDFRPDDTSRRPAPTHGHVVRRGIMFAAMGALRSITADDEWTLTIGDLDVWPVFDGLAREDPTALYRVSHGEATAKGFAAEDWLPHRDLLNPSGQIEHAYGG